MQVRKCSMDSFQESRNLNGTDAHPCSDIFSSVGIKQISLAIGLAFAIELRVTSNGYRSGGADGGARQ